MATRGVNGASSGSLNERFIKCAGCNVNVPKEDMLALGQCTVCGRPYEASGAGQCGGEVRTVAFGAADEQQQQQQPSKPKRKRWAVLTSRKGRTYYHNSETGEDRWDKPADLEADAAEDAFVPFKNDAVKKAVLREQAKLEATRMGVPMQLVAANQHELQQQDVDDDPFTKMAGRGSGGTAARETAPAREISPKRTPVHESVEGAELDERAQHEQDSAGGSCAVM